VRSFLPQITSHLRLGLRWPDGLRAMRHRNFRLFFFGQLVSLIGTWMQTTAQQWLVYRLTGSQLSLGAVTFANFIPVLLLSLFMGVLVDRLPRRRLLLLTQTCFMALAIILALLTYLERIQYPHIIALAFLLGIANSLDMPARQAFYIDLVEREELMNAIALNSSVFNGARVVGPALGGLIVAAMGEAPAFAINALTYLAVIGGLLLMRLPVPRRAATPGTGIGDLRRGLRYLISDSKVFGLVSMVALLSVVGYPFMVLMPAMARDVLGIGVGGFGGLMSAMGVGAFISAISLAFWGDRQRKGRLLVMSRGLFSLALLGLGLSRSTPLSMLMLAISGFAFITQLAVTNTLIQLVVPDELRGRVMSTYTWALGGFWPLGALMIGALGDKVGAGQAVLVSAGGCALLSLLGSLGFREIKEMSA